MNTVKESRLTESPKKNHKERVTRDSRMPKQRFCNKLVILTAYLICCTVLLYVSSPRRHEEIEMAKFSKVPAEKVRTDVTKQYMRAALFHTTLNDPCSLLEENFDDQVRNSKRFEIPLLYSHRLDVVIAAYERSATALLSHLDKCLTPSTRVYIYVATDMNQLNNESVVFKQHPSNKTKQVEEYSSYNTSFKKIIVSIPNAGSDDATAYLAHLSSSYFDLATYTAFFHDHVGSWHSSEPCKLLHCGLKNRARLKQPFIELNDKWNSGRRCISARPNRKKGIFGLWGPRVGWYLDYVRDDIYLKKKWIKWTNGEPLPDRITSWCCAQFLASRDAIRARPEKTWESLYNASVLEPWKGWEVLWEILLDPTRTRDLLKC